MITGSVYVDLTCTHDDADRQISADRSALAVLPSCPPGVRVIVDLGARRYVSQDVARLVAEHDHRLAFDIRGSDPRAVSFVIQATRSGWLP